MRNKVIIFDWAGTIIDEGSLAPVLAFQRTFDHFGVPIEEYKIRNYMGMDKSSHLLRLMEEAQVDEKFHSLWYEQLKQLQLAAIEERRDLAPGLLYVVETCRADNWKIATCTGYTRELLQPVLKAAKAQGFEPDFSITSDEVKHGRPAPFMIYRILEHFNVWNTVDVIKVGDTPLDMQEAVNANCVGVGISKWGNEFATKRLSLSEPVALAEANRSLYSNGAAFVIPEVKDLLECL